MKKSSYYIKVKPSIYKCEICKKKFKGRKGRKVCDNIICRKEHHKKLNIEYLKIKHNKERQYKRTKIWDKNI